MNGLIRSIFFGNYFYGICAAALSVEATLQQLYPLSPLVYYLFVFAATTLYYTHAYIAEPAVLHASANPRTQWYAHNRRLIQVSQILLTLVCIACVCQLLIPRWQNILHMNTMGWVLALVFPLTAILYYGSIVPGSASNNLRNQGWIKPFVIGFVWAGPVTLYPILFHHISAGTPYTPGLVGLLLFIKNFMYVTMLCIMFDIKDYAADHNQQLKTFVVRLGLRRTIFYVLIPLTLAGLGTFIIYALLRDFPLLRILVNTIPFLLLIIVAYSMHRRKSILYYLAIIDGLMLVKAICGIVGITLIK